MAGSAIGNGRMSWQSANASTPARYAAALSTSALPPPSRVLSRVSARCLRRWRSAESPDLACQVHLHFFLQRFPTTLTQVLIGSHRVNEQAPASDPRAAPVTAVAKEALPKSHSRARSTRSQKYSSCQDAPKVAERSCFLVCVYAVPTWLNAETAAARPRQALSFPIPCGTSTRIPSTLAAIVVARRAINVGRR
ncbi:hypothetical protein FB451DRAFT_1367372 [Mycena latifolia]|nr:hypothetical protein FB451DRAFT_1367372 [Mycena latifolia]